MCPGCPQDAGLRLCMLRHVAALFLRDPTADALLMSAHPADARNVTSTFHKSRRPWVPRACRERLSMGCPESGGLACSQRYVSAAASGHWCRGRAGSASPCVAQSKEAALALRVAFRLAGLGFRVFLSFQAARVFLLSPHPGRLSYLNASSCSHYSVKRCSSFLCLLSLLFR